MLNVIQHYRTDGTIVLGADDAKSLSHTRSKDKGQAELRSEQVSIFYQFIL